jgi:ATP-dependent RNA circularization protein (DNA/RNA ligase family)
MERYKFPRTPHVPWSLGYSGDDIRLANMSNLMGKKVMISEKLDGENTTIYSDGYIHARSRDGRYHPSQSWVKNFMADKALLIPNGFRIIGESLAAIHSIEYTRLPTLFFLIAVINRDNMVVSWSETYKWAEQLGLTMIPSIGTGTYDLEFEKQIKTSLIKESVYGDTQEGYVIRNIDAFSIDKYSENVVKYVRADHVQTDEHWATVWKPAKIYREDLK